MKNILVTGGAGFMGSHFIDLLMTSREYKIYCIDKLTYAGTQKNIESAIKKGMRFWGYGIEDPYILGVLDEFEIECVVNFAAETHVDRAIRNPKAFLQTDIMGLFNLVVACRETGVKKFVHISTDEVYGPISEKKLEYAGYQENPLAMKSVVNEATELYPLKPTSPYSASKAAADLLLLSYYKTYGFPVTIVRPCNNYGPRQYPEKLIPMAITRLLNNKEVLLHGEGREVREWIWVKDCAAAIFEIMDKGKPGEIYNVGSGERIDNLTVICKLIDLWKEPNNSFTGYDCHIKKIPNRPGNDHRYAMDSSKFIESVLGWSGKYYNIRDLNAGLEETMEWYRKNRNHWVEIDFDDNIYKENEGYLR